MYPPLKQENLPNLLTYLNAPSLVSSIQSFLCIKSTPTLNPKSNKIELSISTNPFLHSLFKFGSALGDEAFYAAWFSSWFWNVDGAVGRRVVLVWAIVMFIGQGLKDIIRSPRPSSPPVIRLESKWVQEYGMPSTHAIVSIAVPFSTIIFTNERYLYPLELGLFIALSWSILVCTSRVYLGMHSILDILAGLTLVSLLFLPVIPLVDMLDPIILRSKYGGLALFFVGIILSFCTPGGDRWTPARGDTIMILGSTVGLISGAWLNFQLGYISGPQIPPPYNIIWPSLSMIALGFVRLAVGLAVVAITRLLAKQFFSKLFNQLFKICNDDDEKISSIKMTSVLPDLSTKFLTYSLIGFNVVFLCPAIFRVLHIQRPTFHTEI